MASRARTLREFSGDGLALGCWFCRLSTVGQAKCPKIIRGYVQQVWGDASCQLVPEDG